MNICLLTTHLNTGGITSYLLTLSQDLCRRGHHVYVVTSGGSCEKAFVRAGATLHILDIRTKSIASPRLYRSLPVLCRWLKDERIEILHAQTRVTQVLSHTLSALTGIPYVSTCHGFFRRRLFRRLLPCWGQRVIAISPAVATHLAEDFGLPLQQIALVRNGIDLDDFPPVTSERRAACRQAFDVATDRPVIGIIARLSDVKGHPILLAAMPVLVAQLPDVLLLIVGEGKMEASLREQVSALELQNHVIFYPLVNRTQEMLPLFDVFVMPSLQEGLGLSVMEAQAAGLPVVASRVGGLANLVEHDRTGLLVPPGEPTTLAAAILDVLLNPERARAMGRAARTFIGEQYSAARMGRETENFYRQCLQHNT